MSKSLAPKLVTLFYPFYIVTRTDNTHANMLGTMLYVDSVDKIVMIGTDLTRMTVTAAETLREQ